ncbi:MAG: ABC transporter permease, partial [Acidobacteriaceae bacterium]
MFKGWRDVRFGLRMLARNKGFAAVAMLALALGIGPNVAIFSIIWATFLAPQPYPHANQLVVVWNRYRGERYGTRAQDYAAFAAASRSFQILTFTSWTTLQFTSADHAVESVYGRATTPGDITKLLGLPMALGREFLPGEGTPGNDRVVILTHRLWETRFHGDPGVLGKQVLIEDQPYTVVGVILGGALDRIPGTEFMVPTAPRPGVATEDWGNMMGRLKPGIGLAQAQAEIAAIDRRLAPDRYGASDASSWSISVEPFHNDWLDQTLARNLWLLLAAVGLVLLIACANVANLLLARGAARQQELALRTALGATRRQIVAQSLTESLTLALLGGAAGIVLGWAIMKASLAILPLVTQTAEAVVRINVPVQCFALGITLLGGIVFGCAPAWQAAHGGLAETLKQGARSHSSRARSRTQGFLVTAEFALALTLLASAGLALHSFWNLSRIDLGINPQNVITGTLSRRTPGGGQNHAAVPPPPQIVTQLQQILDRVRAVPGVQAAALAMRLPLQGRTWWSFQLNGQPTDTQHRLTADFETVTPSFRQTLQVRMLRGRFLQQSDRQATPLVAVISESFARRYFAGLDPLTQRFTIALPDPVRNQPGPPASFQIVGVFHDMLNNRQLTASAEPEALLSLWQLPSPDVQLAARTAGDPG